MTIIAGGQGDAAVTRAGNLDFGRARLGESWAKKRARSAAVLTKPAAGVSALSR